MPLFKKNSSKPVTIQVQTVLYNTKKEDVIKSVESIANASKRYSDASEKELNVIYSIGDASENRILSDEDVQLISKQFDDLIEFKYTFFDNNTGYGKGHNLLGADAGADYICPMNPDIIVLPAFFLTMLKPFEDPQVGMTEARQTPVEHNKEYDPVTKETGWASGACFMVRGRLFHDLEGFDCKTFHMYLEDVDFSWRVRFAGYKIIYRPSAPVFHAKRISLTGNAMPSDNEILYSSLGHLLFSVKWGKPERAEKLSRTFLSTGHPLYIEAVNKFRQMQNDNLLPKPITTDKFDADFVGELYYAKNRFDL